MRNQKAPVSDDNVEGADGIERQTSYCAKKIIAPVLQSFGKGHDLEWKRRWIKVLESLEMSVLLLEGFGTINDAIVRLVIVQNLSSCMNEKIGSLKKDVVHTQRTICSMVAFENANRRSIAKVLKVDKRFVSNAIKCKERLRSLTKLLWTSEAHKT